MSGKALVLGSGGYLGQHLTRRLASAGFDVCAASKRTAEPFTGSVRHVVCDVTDKSSVARLDLGVDLIFHFAGCSGTESGFRDYERFVRVNEVGLLNILDEHRTQASSARLVFPSSRLVYRGVPGLPLKEDSEKEARTVYAQNKLACENYLFMYQQYFDIRSVVFRIGVPYGEALNDKYPHGTVPFMLHRAKQGENIPLFGGGTLARTFTHVEDIVRCIIEASQRVSAPHAVFNVGGETLSLAQAAAVIARKFRVTTTAEPWPALASRIESGDTIFDSSKLEELIEQANQHTFAAWVASL